MFDKAKLKHITLGNKSVSEGVEIGSILKESLIAIDIFSEEADIVEESITENLPEAKLKKNVIKKIKLCGDLDTIIKESSGLEHFELMDVIDAVDSETISDKISTSLIETLNSRGSHDSLKVFKLFKFTYLPRCLVQGLDLQVVSKRSY